MKISCNCITTNNKNCGAIEQNIKSTSYSKDAKDQFFLTNYLLQNLISFENYLLPKNNDIITYYYPTFKYLLSSEEFIKNFTFKNTSKNFVSKTMMNSLWRNDLSDNYYNDDYINNNYKYINKAVYNNNNKINFLSNKNNYNEFMQRTNFFSGGNNNNLYIGNPVAKKLQNNVFNTSTINTGHNDEISSSNNCKTISNSSVHINIPKNIINNKIDCPPFIPRKKSEDSLSGGKESDSTSAISEKRDEENANDNVNKREKKNETEYLVEMFGRRGWICKLCNNFNYETRVKCNRCGILKRPKKLTEIKQRSEDERNKEGDWCCVHCKNLNYSFRTICNRCKIPKFIAFINNNMVNEINLPMIQSPSFFYINKGKSLICNSN